MNTRPIQSPSAPGFPGPYIQLREKLRIILGAFWHKQKSSCKWKPWRMFSMAAKTQAKTCFSSAKIILQWTWPARSGKNGPWRAAKMRSLKKGLKYIHCRERKACSRNTVLAGRPIICQGGLAIATSKACRVFWQLLPPGFSPAKIGAGKLRPACKIERESAFSLAAFSNSSPISRPRPYAQGQSRSKPDRGRPQPQPSSTTLSFLVQKSCGQGRQ